MNTPHKKIILSAFFSLAVVLGAYYFGIYKEKSVSYQTGLVTEGSATNNFLQADTDKDGLKYWEEALWKTDPNNPDTDGDGTPDGEEAKAGRDPTVAGPDDKLKSIPIFDETGATTTISFKLGASLTDALARDLYANYSILKQSGNLTPENQAQINETLGTSVEQIIAPKVYTLSDIKIAQTETSESIKKYGNNIATAMIENLTQGGQNEAVLLNNYVDKGDPGDLQKIKNSAESYKKLTLTLLSVSVPLSAKEEHLSLINSVNFIGRSIEGMAQIDADPVVALVSLKNYTSAPQKIKTSLNDLISYFANQKIVFSKDDAGYIFAKAI